MKDAAARRAIEADLGANFLVEASAGTGKTHSLAARIVRGLVEGAYDVQNTVAVTFTRKAAAELRSRIRFGLERAGANAALEQLDGMLIGTVHAFCAWILRQFPVEVGVSPGFRELDELEDRRMRRRFLREAWDRPDGHALLRELRALDVEPRDLWAALDSIIDNDDVDYPASQTAPPDFSATWKEVRRFAQFLSDSLPPSDEAEPTCKILRAGRDLIARVAGGHPRRVRDQVALLSAWDCDLAPVKRYWGKKRDEQNQRLTPVLEAVATFRHSVATPFLRAWRAYNYGRIVPFLLEVRQRCRRERVNLALLSFSDLQTRSATLLRDCPSVRARMQEQVRHLFVDELQDSDPIQAEIYFLLAGPGPRWTEVVPRDGSLFLVGDPKQSIYRFRRADIGVYNTIRERLIATGGNIVSLETSFRSVPALCDWSNSAFSRLLPIEPDARQARFSALSPSVSSGSGPAVFRLASRSQRYQDVSREESERIAQHIAGQVRDEHTHAWGDFLILTARKSEVRVYQQALNRLGIPSEAHCEEGALGSRAASFLPLLLHLADPQDNANLVGVLRGALFGHSDEELYLHVQSAGSLRPYPAASVGPAQVGSVHASLNRLDAWRLAVRWMPLGAAASLLLEETGLAVLAIAEGQRSLAELRGLVSSLRASGEAGLNDERSRRRNRRAWRRRAPGQQLWSARRRPRNERPQGQRPRGPRGFSRCPDRGIHARCRARRQCQPPRLYLPAQAEEVFRRAPRLGRDRDKRDRLSRG